MKLSYDETWREVVWEGKVCFLNQLYHYDSKHFIHVWSYVTVAEDIKKRWQEYTEELYKKDLHNQENNDGVITHLEPDILECEAKWAFRFGTSLLFQVQF